MRPGLRGLRGAGALAESVASVRRFEVQRVPEDFGSKGVVPDPPTTTMVEGVVAMVLRIGRRHPTHQPHAAIEQVCGERGLCTGGKGVQRTWAGALQIHNGCQVLFAQARGEGSPPEIPLGLTPLEVVP